MPIYKYKCNNCGNEFEKMKKIEDRHSAECDLCDEEAKLKISSFNGHFKGDNFTKTITN
jgi:putative FmdB family regulatory protein